MKKFRFILLCVTIGLMTAGLTGCTKSVYDEKQALDAQKGLLEYVYAEETKLELLRQSGSTALQQLTYQFYLRQALMSDSLSRKSDIFRDSLNNVSSRKRDISIRVVDLATGKPVGGATVSIPTVVGTLLSATSDSATGYAYFPAEKNANVPYPASVIVTKTGYASGTSYGKVYGDNLAYYYDPITSTYMSATKDVYIWNQSKTPNTLKGKVYIENDLTNSAAEIASKNLVSIYTVINNQRFEWATLTDADGNYSFSLPDMATDIYYTPTAIEASTKLYGTTLPGFYTAPSILTVPATFYLGANTNYPTGTNPTIAYPENNESGFIIPLTVDRYHAVTPSLDSNGNKFYANALVFNNTTGVFISATSTSKSPLYINADGTAKTNSSVSSRYVVAKALVDTAVFYDVIENADGYWKTLPVLQINYTKQLITGSTVNEYVKISSFTQKTAGTLNNDPDKIYAGATLNNKIYTTSGVNSTNYNAAQVTGNPTVSTVGTVTSSNLNGGKTITKNLSFGAGKLKTTVATPVL